MFQRIKILTLLQLGGRKRRLTHTKKQAIANVLIKLLCMFVVTFVVYFVLNAIKGMLSFPINQSILTFFLFISQYISIITCTSSLMSILYSSKDNAILLSYPANHNEVFISKLVVAYLNEFNKNLYFLLPLFVAYGIVNGGVGIFYYFASILMLFILPIFPVFIGAIISIPISYIKKLFQKCPWLYVIVILALIIGIFAMVSWFIGILPKPLRLIAMYNKFINGFLSFVASANKFALFYGFVTDIMYSVNVLLNSLWLILVIAGIMVLTNYISMPLYFNLASKTNEHSVKAKQKVAKQVKQKNSLLAFIDKELKLTFRNFNKVLNDYVLIIAMPIVLYLMNVSFSAIYLSSLGKCMVTGLNIVVALLLVTSCNTHSATAITVEGSEFVLLKTAPSKTSNMVWAKILINFCISTVFIIFSSLLMALSDAISISYIWEVCAVLILVNWSHILWSFQLDILNPKLRDYAETGKTDNNQNASKSVKIGMMLALIIGVLAIFLLNEAVDVAWYKVIFVVLGFFILRLFLFVKNLRVFFKRIEY